MQLVRTDFQAILDYLSHVDSIDAEEPYAREVLTALQALIPCDVVGYEEADLEARRFADSTPETAEEDAIYWMVGPCPITEYRARTGDATAVRMSDVIGRARYHELPIYREWYQPVGLDHLLEIAMSTQPRDYRSLVLTRGGDALDFSERDRIVLEALRPHFRAREARAELAKLATARAPDIDDAGPARNAQLTIREREIVALVAAGKTNAQIAAELWVTPGTVKKHLENVYLKLGVGSRAAAASRVQSGSQRIVM
jgi:DNA-binding CsgD family transcriptional regulator